VVPRIRAQQQDGPSDATLEAAPAQQQQQQPQQQQQQPVASTSSGGGNGLLAGGAVAMGVVVFAASRLLAGGPSLAALESEAVPLDVALSNGRPTLVEFYASWCAPSAPERVPRRRPAPARWRDQSILRRAAGDAVTVRL
jgi:thiol-disulfide isomerase/thioredoxin